MSTPFAWKLNAHRLTPYASSLFRELGLYLALARCRWQPFLPYVWARTGYPYTGAGRAFFLDNACLVVDVTWRAPLRTSVFRWEGVLLGKFASDIGCMYRLPRVELVGWD